MDKPWRLDPTLVLNGIYLCVRWATSAGGSPGLIRKSAEKEDSRRTCEHTGWVKEERHKKNRGGRVSVLERWATRLRKRGKKRKKGRVRVLGWWGTRLRKRGKKKKSRGTCEGTGWATRLRKRGKKREKT